MPCYYAVTVGRVPGVYQHWEACKAQVHQYPRAFCRRFKTLSEAVSFLGEDPRPGDGPAVGVNAPLLEENCPSGPSTPRAATGPRDADTPSVDVCATVVTPRSEHVGQDNMRADTPILHLPIVDSSTTNGPGFYCVVVGRQPGIYTNWIACRAQVHKYTGSVFKKVSTYPQALQYLHSIETGKSGSGSFGDLSRESLCDSVDLDATVRPYSPLLTPHTLEYNHLDSPQTCVTVKGDSATKRWAHSSSRSTSTPHCPITISARYNGASVGRPRKRHLPVSNEPSIKRRRSTGGPLPLSPMEFGNRTYDFPSISSFMSAGLDKD